MTFLFQEILFKPLFNALVFIYNIVPGHDLGIAIILLTVIIRLILTPLSIKALASQRALSTLQPKIQELQKKYKKDKQALGQATMKLYKEHNVNPFGGCLPILIQLPVILALYRVFISGLKPEALDMVYGFISNPGVLNTTAFGFLSLGASSPVLALIVGALQGYHSKNTMSQQKEGGQQAGALKMGKQMLYFFPILMVVISWNLPSGLVLYFIMTTIFSIFEQWYIKRKYEPQRLNN